MRLTSVFLALGRRRDVSVSLLERHFLEEMRSRGHLRGRGVVLRMVKEVAEDLPWVIEEVLLPLIELLQ